MIVDDFGNAVNSSRAAELAAKAKGLGGTAWDATKRGAGATKNLAGRAARAAPGLLKKAAVGTADFGAGAVGGLARTFAPAAVGAVGLSAADVGGLRGLNPMEWGSADAGAVPTEALESRYNLGPVGRAGASIPGAVFSAADAVTGSAPPAWDSPAGLSRGNAQQLYSDLATRAVGVPLAITNKIGEFFSGSPAENAAAAGVKPTPAAEPAKITGDVADLANQAMSRMNMRGSIGLGGGEGDDTGLPQFKRGPSVFAGVPMSGYRGLFQGVPMAAANLARQMGDKAEREFNMRRAIAAEDIGNKRAQTQLAGLRYGLEVEKYKDDKANTLNNASIAAQDRFDKLLGSAPGVTAYMQEGDKQVVDPVKTAENRAWFNGVDPQAYIQDEGTISRLNDLARTKYNRTWLSLQPGERRVLLTDLDAPAQAAAINEMLVGREVSRARDTAQKRKVFGSERVDPLGFDQPAKVQNVGGKARPGLQKGVSFEDVSAGNINPWEYLTQWVPFRNDEYIRTQSGALAPLSDVPAELRPAARKIYGGLRGQ